MLPAFETKTKYVDILFLLPGIIETLAIEMAQQRCMW